MTLLRESNKLPREFQEISDYVDSPDLSWDFENTSVKLNKLENIKERLYDAKQSYYNNANKFVWGLAVMALTSISVFGTLRLGSYFDTKKQFKISDMGRRHESANASKDAVEEFRDFADLFRENNYVVSLSELQNSFYAKKGIDASELLNYSEKNDLMSRKELGSLIDDAEKKYDSEILRIEQSYQYKANKLAGRMAWRDGLLFYTMALASIVAAFKCKIDAEEKADEIGGNIYAKVIARLNLNNESYLEN